MDVRIKAAVQFTVSGSSLEDGMAEYDELTVAGLLKEIVDKAIACDEISCKVEEGPNTLEELDALKWADLRDCTGVADISPLTRIPGLRWLDLGGCTTLHDLPSLANLGELQALVLHGCTNVTDLSPLGAARSLQYLVLTDCVGVTDLRPLEVLPGGGTVWVQGSGVRWAPPGLRWSVVGLGA